MNARTLKKHLRYIVPQMRLVLIKEPGPNPCPIYTPADLDQFVEPLKHYSDYVPKADMCPPKPRNQNMADAALDCGT